MRLCGACLQIFTVLRLTSFHMLEHVNARIRAIDPSK